MKNIIECIARTHGLSVEFNNDNLTEESKEKFIKSVRTIYRKISR